MRLCVVAGVMGAAIAAVGGPACGQVFSMRTDPTGSTLTGNVALIAPLAGSLIGNFDPVSQPTGTQTRLGLFGGSGNQRVNLGGDASATGQPRTVPTAAFTMDVELAPAGGTVQIRGLTADLLAGARPEIELVLELLYPTFRTISPSSLFPGGTPIPFPLGQAVITNLTLTQGALPGGGPLVPDPAGGYTFTVVVPVTAEVSTEVLGQPPAPFPPVPLPLTLRGNLTIDPATSRATATIQASATIEQTIPGPLPGITDQPTDLPTILPPGQIAKVLLTLAAQRIDVGFGFDSSIRASGAPRCVADFNGDGELDIRDFSAFQNAFALGSPDADVNEDGELDIRDFSAFQNLFALGC